MLNEEYIFAFSNEYTNIKFVRNVDNYKIAKSSIVINLDTKSILILPANPQAICIQRKLGMWQSDVFKNVEVKNAHSIIVIEDKNLENPDTGNEQIINFPDIQLDLMKKSLCFNEIARKEIIDSKWEHVSKENPSLNHLSLWKTKSDKISDIGGFIFDPFYVTGMTSEYDAKKEMSFKMRNYMWFTPLQTHCGIHNQHNFIEIHTQISGVGRMVKFSNQNYMDIYECQHMSPGNTQSHAYCIIEEAVKDRNLLKFSYPWHEYYSDTDCIWLVTEFWPCL
jgi:hypothetical protein